MIALRTKSKNGAFIIGKDCGAVTQIHARDSTAQQSGCEILTCWMCVLDYSCNQPGIGKKPSHAPTIRQNSFPTLRHAKALEHLCCGTKSDHLAFLADSQSREENEDQPVLSKWQTEMGVTGDLNEETPVPPLEEELVLLRLPDGRTTKDEWPR